MRFRLSLRQANAQTKAARCDGGFIRLYNGTRPTDADTALSGNTLLATGGYSNPAFGAADSTGTCTSNAISSETNAPNAGTATFARLFESDGTTVVADVSVGIAGSGAELIVSTLTIGAGATVVFLTQSLQDPVGN